MSNTNEFVIKNGILMAYNGSFGNVVIPEEVTRIPYRIFSSNNELTSISLPNHPIHIDSYAFADCHGLKKVTVYPSSATCESDSVFFGDNAFLRCDSLESVEFPNGKLTISAAAFGFCSKLSHLIFPCLPDFIDSTAFVMCNEIAAEIPSELLEVQNPIPGGLAKFTMDVSDFAFASMTLYQKGTAWQNWRSRRKPAHPAEEFEHLITMLEAQDPLDFKTGKIIAEYIANNYKNLSAERIEKMMSLYPPKKSKDMDALTEIRGLMLHLGRDVPEENPAEAAFRELTEQVKPHPDVTTAVKKGIHWKGEKTLCPKEALIALLSCYAHEWDRCAEEVAGEMTSTIMLKDGLKVTFRPEADRVVQFLEPVELNELLNKLVKGAKYRPFLLSWARFADDASIAAMTSTFKKLQRGTAKDRYLAQNMEQALLLSDTRTAMLFYDQIETLDRYAKMRGLTAMEMRDTAMMPEFGFDADGVKRYDIGGNTIEVHVNSDFTYRLVDTKKNKEIRSIPKKSDDPAKAESAAKNFAEFKKEVKTFVKLRSEQLCRMHLTGETVTPELWRKVYLEHPIIRHLSKHIVWMDEANTTFTVVNGNVVTVDQNAYTPQGAVHVAHVLELEEADVLRWQHVLTEIGQTQLFEQVWEPVIHYEEENIPSRYSGIVISSAERNTLKTNLKRRGVNVHSGEMMREFNARSWGYDFYGNNTMYLGKSLELEYEVDDKNGCLTLGKATLGWSGGERELNAVLMELDRITIKAHIAKDQAQLLSDSVLNQFSAAQISEFVDTAVSYNATNCTAVLLNYKNEHYPEYTAIDAFVLEW